MMPKTFYEILSNFSKDPLKARARLSDRRLSSQEKLIIGCYLLLRDNDSKEVVRILSGQIPSQNIFIKAQMDLLLGLAHNNLSHYQEAESYLLDAQKVFREQGIFYFDFIASQNLFNVYGNCTDLKKMEQTLDHVKTLQLTEPSHQRYVLRCEFVFFNKTNQDQKALLVLNQINETLSEMNDAEMTIHLIDRFNFHIKTRNFSACQEVLERFKDFRKFQITENYQFMSKLLKNFRENKPIYVTDADFKDVPFLYHEIKVIQELDAGNLPAANMHWKKLQEMAPEIYLENFVYNDVVCIFSLCLEKHSQVFKGHESRQILLELSPSEDKKIEAMARLFMNANGPLVKEDIFKALWGREVTSKDDLVTLSRTIYRLKNKLGLSIKSRKGAYYLETNSKIKVS